MEELLLMHVAPNIHARYGIEKQVAKVLALPLLWACFKERALEDGVIDDLQLAPCYVRDRVLCEYEVIRQLDEAVNPVRKASTFFVCLLPFITTMSNLMLLLLLGPHHSGAARGILHH